MRNYKTYYEDAGNGFIKRVKNLPYGSSYARLLLAALIMDLEGFSSQPYADGARASWGFGTRAPNNELGNVSRYDAFQELDKYVVNHVLTQFKHEVDTHAYIVLAAMEYNNSKTLDKTIRADKLYGDRHSAIMASEWGDDGNLSKWPYAKELQFMKKFLRKSVISANINGKMQEINGLRIRHARSLSILSSIGSDVDLLDVIARTTPNRLSMLPDIPLDFIEDTITIYGDADDKDLQRIMTVGSNPGSWIRHNGQRPDDSLLGIS
jgi:hypothetical protein